MTEAIQTLSLGQQLTQAREALNLSIEEVASKTNLKKNHIEALENDIFILQSVPPAFVRGYVRSYVRFLRLPEALVGSVNYGEVTIPSAVQRKVKAASIPVHNPKKQGRWVKILTWLILLAAAGMTLVWWWQEHQKEQRSSEQLVGQVEMAQAASGEKPSEQAVEITPSFATSNNSENAVPLHLTPSATQTAAQAEVQVQTEVQAQTPAQPEAASVQATDAQATDAQAVNSAEKSVNEPVAETPAAEQNVLVALTQTANESTEQSQPTEAINDELRIEITQAQSWITVRHGKRKLAEKLYNGGEVLTFNGNEHYSLTVGAPANVKIYYKGQLVPLKVDGRVARFKLPLAN